MFLYHYVKYQLLRFLSCRRACGGRAQKWHKGTKRGKKTPTGVQVRLSEEKWRGWVIQEITAEASLNLILMPLPKGGKEKGVSARTAKFTAPMGGLRLENLFYHQAERGEGSFISASHCSLKSRSVYSVSENNLFFISNPKSNTCSWLCEETSYLNYFYWNETENFEVCFQNNFSLHEIILSMTTYYIYF